MKKKYESDILRVLHQSVSNLHQNGLVDDALMREFDEGCLTSPREFKPELVKSLREREHVSQALLADVLGVSIATISQWENGRRRPDGPARKLLILAMDKGLAHIR